MYKKDDLNELYQYVLKYIDISDEMFETAEKEYTALGKWIDENTPEYKIAIYPQGSFALGTVVRPIDNSDDYDLDLVCQFEQQYNLKAKELKVEVVKPLLTKYRKGRCSIEEKRRCWHIEYIDVPHFHLDVIPGYLNNPYLNITDHDEEANTYEYIPSNPAGYISWFYDRCKYRREKLYEAYQVEHQLVLEQADIEDVKRRKVKTPLQKVVQLLKRHRDVYFLDKRDDLKPVSIIITTICANLYNNEDNIYDALMSILENAAAYIINNKRDGLFYIENPVCTDENFADKWNTHPERAYAFWEWLNSAKNDLVGHRLEEYTKVDMGRHIKNVFGENTGISVYSEMANLDHVAIKGNKLNATSTGMLSATGTIPVLPNHHHGR